MDWRARGRRRLAYGAVGALVLIVVLYRASWLVALIVAYAAIAFLVGWLSVNVAGGGTVGAKFDPERRTVLLWGVHEGFKRAVERGQRPDPNVRRWQTQ
jgi:hypothetical protein